ncbi:HTH_Tnp_Tc3_2 domain-containing protein [Trichonephila clavipes]|nr:HTH_Tnp_Tc3_2 domain-containing protein [Trichonephila clavipes]
MTGHIYRDVILEQHVRLFRGAMGAEFLFMDDNARPHRANIVDECLQSEDITRMDLTRSFKCLYLNLSEDNVALGLALLKMPFLIRSKKIDLIQLAGDLDESPDLSMSKIVLRDLIISSKYYKEEEAKERELLEVITAERLETEQQQKLEQQEQLSIEKLRLEIELSRNANQSATQNNGQTSRVKSLDEIVKMVRLLTVKVPNKSDG